MHIDCSNGNEIFINKIELIISKVKNLPELRPVVPSEKNDLIQQLNELLKIHHQGYVLSSDNSATIEEKNDIHRKNIEFRSFFFSDSSHKSRKEYLEDPVILLLSEPFISPMSFFSLLQTNSKVLHAVRNSAFSSERYARKKALFGIEQSLVSVPNVFERSSYFNELEFILKSIKTRSIVAALKTNAIRDMMQRSLFSFLDVVQRPLSASAIPYPKCNLKYFGGNMIESSEILESWYVLYSPEDPDGAYWYECSFIFDGKFEGWCSWTTKGGFWGSKLSIDTLEVYLEDISGRNALESQSQLVALNSRDGDVDLSENILDWVRYIAAASGCPTYSRNHEFLLLVWRLLEVLIFPFHFQPHPHPKQNSRAHRYLWKNLQKRVSKPFVAKLNSMSQNL